MPNNKQAVYSAEHALCAMLDHAYEAPIVHMHGSAFTLPGERKFANLDNVQTYVNKVLALSWIQEAHPRMAKVPVFVRERAGQRFAHYEAWKHVIAVPPYVNNKAWAMREMVILHELSHHLAIGHGHDEQFCATFVELVSNILSTEAGFILTTLFHDEGVKIA